MARYQPTLLVAWCALLLSGPACAIDCYQCQSTDHTNPFQCDEYLSSDISIEPQTCSAVYDARYCIKHTGRFAAASIDCYRCSASEQIDCTDSLVHLGALAPVSCSDVYDARYCIKATGRFGGGLGTKRYCSSLDLGNYCNYVQQSGDMLEYRSCIFTCSSDGCNSAVTVVATTSLLLLLPTLAVLL